MGKFKGSQLTKLAIAFSLALPLVAGAQNPSTDTNNSAQRPAPAGANQSGAGANAGSDTTKASRSDIRFMNEAAMGGMLEVELGRVAMQNAASDQVKQFGQKMVDDHGKANDELKTLAQSEGVTLPTQLDSKHSKEVQRMQKMTGAEFDHEYMKMMQDDHKKDIKAFQHEAQNGDDPEVKAFASRTLPTLRAHQSLVEQTRSAMGDGGRRNSDAATRTAPAGGQSGQTQQ